MIRAQRLALTVEPVLRARLYRCFRGKMGPKQAARVWDCDIADALTCFRLWQRLQNQSLRAAGLPVRIIRHPRKMAIWPGSFVGPRRGQAGVTGVGAGAR